MRFVLFLTLAACGLQGCTVLAAGVAADTNRQRRAEATVSGADLAATPPVPGDRLTLRLATGEQVEGAFLSASPDSLVLLGTRTYALRDVARVERPWVRADGRLPLALGALADFAALYYIQRSLYSGLRFNIRL